MITPKHFLFVTWEGGGNVPPVLGAAERLIHRGHQVWVLAEPCLRKQIQKIGAQYVPFKTHFIREDRAIDLIQDWKAKPLSVPSIDNILIGPAQSVAEETMTILERIPIDVVVADFMMPGALIAAEAKRVPRVALFHMPEYFPGPGRPPGGLGLLPDSSMRGRLRDKLLERVFFKVLKQYNAPLNKVRRQFGLQEHESIIETFHSADLRLLQTCKAFDAPITPAPKNVRYVGPVLDDPIWSEDNSFATEMLKRRLGDTSKPNILVSLSSTFQNQKDLLNRIIKAFEQLEANAIVTLGPAMAKEQFTLTDNVTLLGSAPHSQILPMVDAVVTHAGHGTVMRALSFGKPLVCLPMGRDQLDNAALVAHHKAGLKLKQSASVKKIRQAIQMIIDNETYREGSRHLQHAIQEDLNGDRTTEYLEQLDCGSVKDNFL